MGSGTVVNKRMSFLASLVWGLTTVLVVAVLCVTGAFIYTLNVAQGQADGALQVVRSVISGAPDLVAALPPVISDVLHDRRAPEYADKLEVAVSLVEDPHQPQRGRPVLTIHNNGPDLVSLLSMRVVVRDSRGGLLSERQEWVATPVAVADCDDMPGPIMPGATRRVSMGSFRMADDAPDGEALAETATAEYEITDVRVWVQPQPQPPQQTQPIFGQVAGS